MKTNNSHLFRFYLLVFNLISFIVVAQDEFDPGFPTETDPGVVPVATIDSWITPMCIVAILLCFYYFKKYKKASI